MSAWNGPAAGPAFYRATACALEPRDGAGVPDGALGLAPVMVHRRVRESMLCFGRSRPGRGCAVMSEGALAGRFLNRTHGPGEGAAVSCLRRARPAKRRGARSCRGGGFCHDSARTRHASNGAARPLPGRFRDAGEPGRGLLSTPNGTGTAGNDRRMRRRGGCLRHHADALMISSTKSMRWPPDRRTGAVELPACIHALRDVVIARPSATKRPDSRMPPRTLGCRPCARARVEVALFELPSLWG